MSNSPRQNVNAFIGKRLKSRRVKLGLTLSDLSERLGISHQQIQKYEQGITRVSASFLFEASEILGVPINYFYEGYENLGEKYSFLGDRIDLKVEKPFNLWLVENDPADMLLLRETILESHPSVNVYSLHDEEQTLNILRDRDGGGLFPRPDLIFMSILFHKPHPLQTLREIKRDRNLQDIPVIILSNSLNIQNMMDAYKNYASGYIFKDHDQSFKCRIEVSLSYWFSMCLPRMACQNNP